MPDRPPPSPPDARPSAASRFGWHPEPGLIGVDDAVTSRPALEDLGAAAWKTALDYLYDQALRRSAGTPTGYAELRETFYASAAAAPGASPAAAAPAAAAPDRGRGPCDRS